jgi:hypothetical protein
MRHFNSAEQWRSANVCTWTKRTNKTQWGDLGSVDIHAMARKAAERWMKAQKLVSVLS